MRQAGASGGDGEPGVVGCELGVVAPEGMDGVGMNGYDDARIWKVGLGEIGREECPEMYIFIAAVDILVAGELALNWARETKDEADPLSCSELISIELISDSIIGQPGIVNLGPMGCLYLPENE